VNTNNLHAVAQGGTAIAGIYVCLCSCLMPVQTCNTAAHQKLWRAKSQRYPGTALPHASCITGKISTARSAEFLLPSRLSQLVLDGMELGAADDLVSDSSRAYSLVEAGISTIHEVFFTATAAKFTGVRPVSSKEECPCNILPGWHAIRDSSCVWHSFRLESIAMACINAVLFKFTLCRCLGAQALGKAMAQLAY